MERIFHAITDTEDNGEEDFPIFSDRGLTCSDPHRLLSYVNRRVMISIVFYAGASRAIAPTSHRLGLCMFTSFNTRLLSRRA